MLGASLWADRVATILSEAAAKLPQGFFCSFDYTTTGQNFCHPIAWGSLVRGLAISSDEFVGIDVRLNDLAGCKFQPDVVLFNRALQPIVCIDYESPNSSDARVPYKDVQALLTWQKATASHTDYVIVTTLPDANRPSWEVRYTAPGKYNDGFGNRKSEIRENPFRFWHAIYAEALTPITEGNVAWVNLDQKSAKRIFP